MSDVKEGGKSTRMSDSEFFTEHYPDREDTPSSMITPDTPSSVSPDLDSFKKTKRTRKRVDVASIAQRLNVDPFEIMLKIAGNMKEDLGMGKDDEIKLETRLKAATEAAQYMAPKLKSIEHIGEAGDGKVEHKTVIVLPSNNRDDEVVKESERFLNEAGDQVVQVILPPEEDEEEIVLEMSEEEDDGRDQV